MQINSVSFNKNSLKCIKCTNVQNFSMHTDSVSFSGKVNKKNNSAKIPFRLSSKYQDDFHSSALQLYMRKYLDCAIDRGE